MVPARILNSCSNSEGESLHSLYPPRVFTAGHGPLLATGRSLDIALATLAADPSFMQVNEGWAHGLNAAALAGTIDTVALLLLCCCPARCSPRRCLEAGGVICPAFAPHYQDHDPCGVYKQKFIDMLLQVGEDSFEHTYSESRRNSLNVTHTRRAGDIWWVSCVV